jgi:hypothetical protein
MSVARISCVLKSAVVLAWLTIGGNVASHAAPVNTPPAKTSVRSGNHPDFGRIVIDTNGNTSYRVDQDGDHVVVRFADDVTLGDVTLGNAPASPRNVVAMTTDGQTLDLTVTHGARLHVMRLDGRVVVDVLDSTGNAAPPAKPRESNVRPEAGRRHQPSPASSPGPGDRPAAASPAATPIASTGAARVPAVEQALPQLDPSASGMAPSGMAPSGMPPSGMPPSGMPPSSSSPAGSASSEPTSADPGVVQMTQQIPPGRDVMPPNEGPIALLARRVKLPKEMDGSGFLVPFGPATGAASFRSGDSTYIVFDERRPVDMSALRSDPMFSATSVQLLPNGTLFRIPLPASRSIALTQIQQGWRIATLTTVPKQQPIAVSVTDGRLSLAAKQPGDVISLADPETGATLLVGTQHRPGQGLAANRRGTEFILRSTIQGVVVEALSDTVVLKQIPTGFTLTGGPIGLLLSPATTATDALMDAALLTRRLNLSTLPPDALRRLARKQLADAASTPPLARGPKHRIAAESFLSLGLAAEAESLLHMAAEQDPKEAASADTGALTAIAALLAGRPEEASALADPRLDGTDEISLWRAMRQAMQDDGSPRAAAAFAATAPLVFQYPKPIRDHILPLIVETMIKGGEIAPASRLLDQRKNDPALAYARALMRQAEGDTDEALNMLDAVANGRDQFDRARAAIRAVELRLAAGKLDKVQAADALDKLLYAWRGDARELALRERVADLRGQTGAWPVALATLKQAEIDFPERATTIHDLQKGMFAEMIRDQGEQPISPVDFVSTVAENASLMPDSSDDGAAQQSLADRLLALDLPDRARPVLEKLMRAAKSDATKARFGLSLATLESRAGNDAGAQAVLDASESQDLPPDLVEPRTILRAGSVSRMGDPAAAAALLAPLHTSRATEARAQIAENAADWAGAEQAWSENVALTLPESGMLDENQTRTMLRLATATARASDDAGLAALRAKYSNRVAASPLADMFRLLTAEPIRTAADIKRSQQEVSLAASLPADLKALRPGPVAR